MIAKCIDSYCQSRNIKEKGDKVAAAVSQKTVAEQEAIVNKYDSLNADCSLPLSFLDFIVSFGYSFVHILKLRHWRLDQARLSAI